MWASGSDVHTRWLRAEARARIFKLKISLSTTVPCFSSFFFLLSLLMLFSLVRIIGSVGEQIRLFTHPDVYMFTHTCMYTHRRSS